MAVVTKYLADGRTVHWVRVDRLGAKINKRIGFDKREAERYNEKLKADIREGRYQENGLTQFIRVGKLFEIALPLRTNRAADNERQQVRDHVLKVMDWFTSMRVCDVTPPHIAKVVQQIRDTGKLSESSIRNIHSTMSGVFGYAVFHSKIPTNPCKGLLKGTIKRGRGNKREPYSRKEARTVMECDSLMPQVRVWLYLAFYTGMREGEVCGRKFKDWMAEGEPLGALHVHSQYNDEPLKSDDDDMVRPRWVPVHEKLREMLMYWWETGFELVYARRPTEEDFIVPTLGLKPHSRSSAYKIFRTALRRAGVTNRSLHSTRHTFATVARNSSKRESLWVERITHNAEGKTLDRYTHSEWETLCEIVAGVDYSNDRSTMAGFLKSGPPMRKATEATETAPVSFDYGHSSVVEYQGERRTLTAWEPILGLPRKTLVNRLNHGWTVERAFSTPIDLLKSRVPTPAPTLASKNLGKMGSDSRTRIAGIGCENMETTGKT